MENSSTPADAGRLGGLSRSPEKLAAANRNLLKTRGVPRTAAQKETSRINGCRGGRPVAIMARIVYLSREGPSRWRAELKCGHEVYFETARRPAAEFATCYQKHPPSGASPPKVATAKARVVASPPAIMPGVSIVEVAKYLRCHVSTIHRLLRKNAIPYFTVGYQNRFDLDAIDAWTQRLTVAAPPE